MDLSEFDALKGDVALKALGRSTEIIILASSPVFYNSVDTFRMVSVVTMELNELFGMVHRKVTTELSHPRVTTPRIRGNQ